MRGTPTLEHTPFKPTFSDEQLKGMQERVALARQELPAATYAMSQEKYGIQHSWMEAALEYWSKDYDW